MMPNDLPPWHTVYQQSRRWLKAKVFEAMVHGLRELLRVAGGRNAQPSAAVLDGRTLQSTPESGGGRRLRWLQAQKRQQGSHGRGHAGPAARLAGDPDERAGARQVEALGKAVQRTTDNSDTTAWPPPAPPNFPA